MKMPLRILLILLCAILIIAIPFTVSSPNLLNDVKMELMNEGGEEIDFGKLLFSYARAEEEVEEEALDEDGQNDGSFEAHPEWKLPMDFTVPPAPDAALYTEDSYEDETISVKLEHQEMDDGTKMHVAYILAGLLRLRDPHFVEQRVCSSLHLPCVIQICLPVTGHPYFHMLVPSVSLR